MSEQLLHITLAAMLAISVAACSRKAESSAPVSNSEFRVERLFTTDGCTAYRFRDAGNFRYFTKCEHASTSTQWTETCGKNCTRSVEVPNEN